MIRTTAVPRPVRFGTAAIGVAGAFALAGCTAADAGADTTAAPTTAPTTATSAAPEATTTTAPEAEAEPTGAYADGTYTAEGSYATPESVETISVTITLADDLVTAVEVVGDPQQPESERYQGEFIGGIADVVVGQSIDSLDVSRVAGSSLTSGGFNEAVEAIKSEATA